MSEKRDSLPRKSLGGPYAIVKEKLSGTNTDLTGFHFHHGANIYVFSYEKEGVRRHTFIDAGDSRYRKQLLPILVENDVNPTNIERIIITHHHPDHCGLAALLAKESGARILVHPNFKNLVEGEIRKEERRWLGNFDLSQFKEHNMEYLPQSDKGKGRSISGVDFPILGEPIEIGEGAKLEIITIPETTVTHSPTQVFVLYSPGNCPQLDERTGDDCRPTDDILFAGDLWLMTGPLTSGGIRNISRRVRYSLSRLKNLTLGKSVPRRDPREQDPKAKLALKTGFSLIRVKPGHGEEFIGSRIIPRSLFSDTDILIELGYPMDADKSILERRELAPKIAALREQAYSSFIEELLFWREWGYPSGEVSELLVRIYQEQSGGGKLVGKDRKQRRERLKVTLARLKDDEAKPEELHQLAQSTLSELRRVL